MIGGGLFWSAANEAWLDPTKTAQEALSGKTLGEVLLVIGAVAVVGGVSCMIAGPFLATQKAKTAPKVTQKSSVKSSVSSVSFSASIRVSIP